MRRGKAYGVLAGVFINREAEIYQDNAAKNGGWEGTRAFRIVAKEPQTHLLPALNLNRWMLNRSRIIQPGQYLGVWLRPGEASRIRRFANIH